MKRRTLFAFIVVFLCIIPMQAEATPGVTVLSVVPTTYVAKHLGEIFTLDISVTDVTNLCAFEFKLRYNTTLLDALQVVQGSFLPAPPRSFIDKCEINEIDGSVWVSMHLSGSEPPRSGSGTLVSITLNATYAPELPAKAYCALELDNTTLYDSAATPIAQYSANGLYFWESISDDPAEDALLDLATQKGGIGPGNPSLPFAIGELVVLKAQLTYGGAPRANELVAFEVFDPSNQSVITRTGVTDINGIVIIEFRIPALPSSAGTWEAIAVSKIQDTIIWDFVYFTVGPLVVGGGAALIKKTWLITQQVGLNPRVIAAISAVAAMIAVFEIRNHRKKRNKTTVS